MIPRCDVCGDDGSHRSLQVTFTRRNEMTCYCSLCEGLVEAGILRPEIVDGVLRFRRWSPEWKPGDLVPARPPS